MYLEILHVNAPHEGLFLPASCAKYHTALCFCHAFLTARRCAAHRRRVEHPAGRHFRDQVYVGRTRRQNGLLAQGPQPAARDYSAISPSGPAGSDDWQNAAAEGTSAGQGAGSPAGSSTMEDGQGEHRGGTMLLS